MRGFLYERVLTQREIEATFSDEALCVAMLHFEVALARCQAHLGLIPSSAATSIEAAALSFSVDAGDLVREGAIAGSLAIPFVQALTRHVEHTDSQAARHVHFGTTSQDLLDTALVLCTRTALQLLQTQLSRCHKAAVRLAREHLRTPALARTLMQPAGITTFGLKAAHWAKSLFYAQQRIGNTAADSLTVSLGGPTGHLAAFGEHGAALRAALAAELDLSDEGTSWHSGREAWIALASDVALASGAMNKMANDISLMAQFEIDEVSEPSHPQRGGSSAMPHKRNPVLTLRVLANTQPLPALMAQLLSAMKQEHERALGNWQAETAVWPRVFVHTFSAAHALAELLEDLKVNTARCQRNIDALHGVLHADRLAQCFAAYIGKLQAHAHVAKLAQRALQEQQHLATIAKRYCASDARLSTVAVDQIDGCFAGAATVEACASEALEIVEKTEHVNGSRV